MADSRNDQEPSIEEILASIREIISDDDAPAKSAAPAPAPPPPPPPPPPPVKKEDEDVLDLSQFDNKKDPLDGIDFDKPTSMNVEFTDPLAEIEPEPEPIVSSLSMVAPAAAVIETPMEPDESLLTDHAKSASMDSLTRLAQNIAISRAGQGGTLEDIVREMIRPMLRDWLDRNLPPMIERMVERELERLVKESMNR
jgi:hypothetical protein